jgi:hypothetical protein
MLSTTLSANHWCEESALWSVGDAGFKKKNPSSTATQQSSYILHEIVYYHPYLKIMSSERAQQHWRFTTTLYNLK